MSNTGVGVMLGLLGGNEETVTAIRNSLGKTIQSVCLDAESNQLRFNFSDGANLTIFDNGQSCCETRYMRTDDNLTEFAGALLLDLELKDAPPINGDYDVHEVQFLDVKTDKGVFQMANHNEHNGYYGGFWIVANND